MKYRTPADKINSPAYLLGQALAMQATLLTLAAKTASPAQLRAASDEATAQLLQLFSPTQTPEPLLQALEDAHLMISALAEQACDQDMVAAHDE